MAWGLFGFLLAVCDGGRRRGLGTSRGFKATSLVQSDNCGGKEVRTTQNIEEILHLLKCVHCDALKLRLVAEDPRNGTEYTFDTCGLALHCDACGSYFPVTDDGIPILWTPIIREILSKENNSSRANGSGEKALYSNISNYDRISDDYSLNFRRDDLLIKRIKAGVRRLKKQQNQCVKNKLFHLDIGCGPGHLLEWLGDLGYCQLGLDVSLANLRNTRKSTGAYVVLGDATEIPFVNDAFDLVTASAVLHHIYDWKKTVRESCRVCGKKNGGIMFDSEPSIGSLSFSKFAEMIFDMRWPVYKILSYIDKGRMHFRNIALAKNYYRTAEVHNQPGKGLSLIDFNQVFLEEGFEADFFLSPSDQLKKRKKIPWREIDWKRAVLHLLSGHNPANAEYGSITALAVPNKILISNEVVAISQETTE